MARRGDDGSGCVWLLLIIGILFMLGKCGNGEEVGVTGSSGDYGSSGLVASEPKYVTARVLNCRAAPEASAEVVTTLTHATRVIPSEESSGWTRISSSSPECWASSRFLSESPPPAEVQRLATAAEKPERARKPRAPSTASIRARIIEQSIDSYPGNCPCPYNRDRAGRRCGARSAWSRGGGYAPLCFPDDVSEAHIAAFDS